MAADSLKVIINIQTIILHYSPIRHIQDMSIHVPVLDTTATVSLPPYPVWTCGCNYTKMKKDEGLIEQEEKEEEEVAEEEVADEGKPQTHILSMRADSHARYPKHTHKLTVGQQTGFLGVLPAPPAGSLYMLLLVCVGLLYKNTKHTHKQMLRRSLFK